MLEVALDVCHCPVMGCYVPECLTKASLESRKAFTATPLLLPVLVTVKPHLELCLLSPPRSHISTGLKLFRLEPLRKSNCLASNASKAVGKVQNSP